LTAATTKISAAFLPKGKTKEALSFGKQSLPSILGNFHFAGLAAQTQSIQFQMAPTLEPRLPCPFPSGNTNFARRILVELK
jgi:hypothetical protein